MAQRIGRGGRESWVRSRRSIVDGEAAWRAGEGEAAGRKGEVGSVQS